MDDVGELARRLVAVDSVNPTLVEGGAGEAAVAACVAREMAARGLQVSVTEVRPGRPNVVGRVGGAGDGPTLLLLGHTDTVTTAGMERPHDPVVRDGRLYGRGAYDMKGGLAAAIVAAGALVGRVAGEVVVAAVCDEEAGGTGTRALLEGGLRADAAVVTEPTELRVGVSHRGYAGFTIDTHGRAAHGSRPDLGEDAIVKMGPVLTELGRLAERHLVHASLIEGGEEGSSYPARCRVTGEWRTLPDEDPLAELTAAVRRAGGGADVRLTHTGAPFTAAPGSDLVERLCRHAGAEPVALDYWTDAALVQQAGIPTAIFGPAGAGAHAAVEWVDLASATRVHDVLIALALETCGETR